MGTSTNGAGAFGGSINIKTDDFQEEAFAKTSHAYGSFNTRKHNLQIGSGLINNRFNFNGRASLIKSDGFIDRASSDLKSLYLSGGYHHRNHLIKAIAFTGSERTYQAWNGVPEFFLDTNRTYNVYTYEDQVDQYQQDHYQFHYASEIQPNTTSSVAFHYTKGKGFFEQHRADDNLSDYGLNPVVLATDTIHTSDIVRRRWLNNDFYGLTFALNMLKNNVQNTFGGAWNKYEGQHYGEIIWAEYASNSNIKHRYYDNDAVKTDVNIFNKLTHEWTEKLSGYIDLQYRHVDYTFQGFNDELQLANQHISYDFFNPKIGIQFRLQDNLRSYLSFGVANKEPNRSDFVDSSPSSRPSHETLYNAEFGVDWSQHRTWLSSTLYYMHYLDQLVLTGAVNDVGAYTRINASTSYRVGIEFQLKHDFNEFIGIHGNVSFSSNKLTDYQEITDNFDTGIQESLTISHSDIAFSPSLISSLQIHIRPVKHFDLSLSSKYVGDQFLDNTSNESRKLDNYFTTDVWMHWNIKNNISKELGLKLLVNNVLNEKYESNGYTFGYISGGERIQENWYYPQAGTNFLLGVDLSF